MTTAKEVNDLEDFGKDLLITLMGVIAAKALDETVEAIKKAVKKKTSPQPGKHAKRS